MGNTNLALTFTGDTDYTLTFSPIIDYHDRLETVHIILRSA